MCYWAIYLRWLFSWLHLDSIHRTQESTSLVILKYVSLRFYRGLSEHAEQPKERKWKNDETT